MREVRCADCCLYKDGQCKKDHDASDPWSRRTCEHFDAVTRAAFQFGKESESGSNGAMCLLIKRVEIPKCCTDCFCYRHRKLFRRGSAYCCVSSADVSQGRETLPDTCPMVRVRIANRDILKWLNLEDDVE